MARSTDQLQVIPLAGRLIDGRAFQGAATVLFNAALQRQATEFGYAVQWTPAGPIPLRVRKPAEHFDPANDHADPSSTTA